MKTDPSSSILKAQLLVQVSVPGGCSHGILAMPRIRYPLSVAHWLWPCPPSSLFPCPETATAASRGHPRDISVKAAYYFYCNPDPSPT